MSIIHEYRDSAVYKSIIEGEYTGRKVYFRELGTDQQGFDLCWSFNSLIETAERIFESTDFVFCSLKKTTPSMAQIKKMFLQLSQIPFDENRLDSIDQGSWDQVCEKINSLIQNQQFEYYVKWYLETNDKINKEALYDDITKDISRNSQKIEALFKKSIAEVENARRNIDLFINVYASTGNRGIDARLSKALKIVECYLYSPNNIQECLNNRLVNLKRYLDRERQPFPFTRILVHIEGYIFKIGLEAETVKLSREETNFHLSNSWVNPPRPPQDYPSLTNMRQPQLLSFNYEAENPWANMPSSSQSSLQQPLLSSDWSSQRPNLSLQTNTQQQSLFLNTHESSSSFQTNVQQQSLSYHTPSENSYYNPCANTTVPPQSFVSQSNMQQQLLFNAWNSKSSFQSSTYLEKEKIKEHLKQFKQTSLSYEQLEEQTRSFCRKQGIGYKNYLEIALDLLKQELANSNNEEAKRIKEIIYYIQNILNSNN